MNQKIKFGIAFIAGGALFNIGTVFSNVPTSNEVLSDAIAVAIAKVDKYSEDRRNEELDKLPNILDCQNMEWMKNCTELNRNAKRNPTAPMRIQNQQGLEFNFQPGTPSAVIRLQLEQTPEAARDLVLYFDKTWGEYHKSADLFKMEKWKLGDLENIQGLDAAKEKQTAPKHLNTDAISLSVFVESTCPVCERQLLNLSSLQQKYPKLKIRVFQLDNDTELFKRHVTERGLNGRIVSADERKQLTALGIRSWPITWIDNTAVSRRITLVGNRTISQLEDKLQAMTYVQTAKAGK